MPQKTGAPAPPGNACRALDLSRLRNLAGISLEEIAAGTKISLRFLRAIEDEEFSLLPGGIFNTSYLRQYAAAVGYDEAKLLAHYWTTSVSGENSGPPRKRGFLRRLMFRG